MVMTPIPAGTTQWDVPLNERLLELDRRFEEISFNVTEYGATGNGVTDDTTAIQAAINAAASNGGGVVYLPPTASGYLLDSSSLSITTADTTLKGAGGEASKLVLGPNFTDPTMVNITARNCGVLDVWFEGADNTPTNNPVADAIRAIGVRRTRINRCTFFFINGWAIQLQSTAASSTSNPRGSQLGQIYISECAAGVRLFGDAAQNQQMNVSITDLQAAFTGVTSGASANLDVIMIEDAWDVLVQNAIAWMSNGTGSSLHIKGNCAAAFIQNFDGLGSEAGPCVLIEDDAGGFPQNVQIIGGVIQQGTIGMQVTGASRHIRVDTSRIINNQTHGISIENTVDPVYLTNLFFSLSGQGAAGTNHDINWTGSAEGVVDRCRFASPITSVGVAGVQQSVNIASGQDVTFNNVSFAGTGAASTNWFTNLPDAVLLSGDHGRFNFRTRVDFASQIACQPALAADISVSSNVAGSTFDHFRLLGDGDMEWGPGTGARDVTLYRAGANLLKTDDKFLATAGLGVGNSAAATTPGTVTDRIEVFDDTGASIGFIAVYDTIT